MFQSGNKKLLIKRLKQKKTLENKFAKLHQGVSTLGPKFKSQIQTSYSRRIGRGMSLSHVAGFNSLDSDINEPGLLRGKTLQMNMAERKGGTHSNNVSCDYENFLGRNGMVSPESRGTTPRNLL